MMAELINNGMDVSAVIERRKALQTKLERMCTRGHEAWHKARVTMEKAQREESRLARAMGVLQEKAEANAREIKQLEALAERLRG